MRTPHASTIVALIVLVGSALALAGALDAGWSCGW